MKNMTILREGKRERFEIVIEKDSKKVRHICAAFSEAEAIERIKRSYAADDPQVIRVRSLGVLPKRYLNAAGGV